MADLVPAAPWEMDWSKGAPVTAAPVAPPAAPWEMDWSKGAPAPAPKSGVMDFLSSIPRGVVNGLGDFAKFGSMMVDPGTELGPLVGGPDAGTIAHQNAEKVGGLVDRGVEATGLPKPEGMPGRIGAGVGDTLGNPLSYLGPGGLLAKTAAAAGAGAGGEAAAETFPDHPVIARILGGVLGGAPGAILPRGITPNVARNAAHVADADALAARGIPISAGDRVKDFKMQVVENGLAPDRRLNQAEALTRQAGDVIGLPENYLTQGPSGKFTQRMGQIKKRFDTLGSAGDLVPDQQLAGDLNGTYSRLTRTPGVYPESTITATKSAIRRVGDALTATHGRLSGTDYQTLRSDLAEDARNAADHQTSSALNDVVEALDDNFERTNPNLAGQFGQARRDYRNALVLQKALTANADGADGLITPNSLFNATRQVYGNAALSRGQGDLSDLARQSKAVLTGPTNTSNTAHFTRLNAIMNAIAAAGTMSAAHVAGVGNGPELGLLTSHMVAAPLTEPLVRGIAAKVRMGAPVQGYLGNQALAGSRASNPLIPGLLGGPNQGQ